MGGGFGHEGHPGGPAGSSPRCVDALLFLPPRRGEVLSRGGGVSENMSEFYCGGWVEGARGGVGGRSGAWASATTHPPTHHEAFGERSGGG
ncbi:hypothetical protein B9Q03_11695 [Candidatus Marsarchaeota G2 archaeon OSP_D]|jgi:hypothetical protein|uniref:Uncharacterized protein n=1 Tax=Candidatus Marsarchaeota G2 archaeon OSP_D TaxID=1978157 RepID=A0A2R6AJ59_9ARCH|nr:MAG: hypothetical protein B9Q03_11695 [Candidatus Marsarchaeota G2 archaeon OSP_D]